MSWSPPPTRFSFISPKHTKMDSKKEQVTEIALCGWRALGRTELRVDPQQLKRAESRFSGERPKTLDPAMLESSVSPPSGGLCPFVSHGRLHSSPSKEHALGPVACSLLQPPGETLRTYSSPSLLLHGVSCSVESPFQYAFSSKPSPSHACRHPDT